VGESWAKLPPNTNQRFSRIAVSFPINLFNLLGLSPSLTHCTALHWFFFSHRSHPIHFVPLPSYVFHPNSRLVFPALSPTGCPSRHHHSSRLALPGQIDVPRLFLQKISVRVLAEQQIRLAQYLPPSLLVPFFSSFFSSLSDIDYSPVTISFIPLYVPSYRPSFPFLHLSHPQPMSRHMCRTGFRFRASRHLTVSFTPLSLHYPIVFRVSLFFLIVSRSIFLLGSNMIIF
jgi:hypothetical protein